MADLPSSWVELSEVGLDAAPIAAAADATTNAQTETLVRGADAAQAGDPVGAVQAQAPAPGQRLEAMELLFNEQPQDWGFDPETDRILREFEAVREKQLQLALDHINLPPLVVDDVTLDESDDSAAEAFERNAARFVQREEDMGKLMRKLDDLTSTAESIFRFAQIG